MIKKKNKRDFWKKMHFKYRLSVMNESTLEELWKIKASMFSGLALLLMFAFFLIAITAFIIIATPIRYYLPGYMDAEIRGKAIRSAMKADSLEHRLKYQEAYINNLRNVFEGNVQIDSVRMADTISVSENDPLLQKTRREKEYVQQYAEEEKYNLSVLPVANATPMEGLIFLKPMRGIIVNKFDPSKDRYGVVLRTAQRETVFAILEGVVVFSAYDVNSGHTIQIQHKNGFISIYKGNSMVLKEAGDKVRTGEAISILDVDKDNKLHEARLELELWYKGNPMNPEDYISF